jgi:hypothetical protein
LDLFHHGLHDRLRLHDGLWLDGFGLRLHDWLHDWLRLHDRLGHRLLRLHDRLGHRLLRLHDGLHDWLHDRLGHRLLRLGLRFLDGLGHRLLHHGLRLRNRMHRLAMEWLLRLLLGHGIYVNNFGGLIGHPYTLRQHYYLSKGVKKWGETNDTNRAKPYISTISSSVSMSRE